MAAAWLAVALFIPGCEDNAGTAQLGESCYKDANCIIGFCIDLETCRECRNTQDCQAIRIGSRCVNNSCVGPVAGPRA